MKPEKPRSPYAIALLLSANPAGNVTCIPRYRQQSLFAQGHLLDSNIPALDYESPTNLSLEVSSSNRAIKSGKHYFIVVDQDIRCLLFSASVSNICIVDPSSVR